MRLEQRDKDLAAIGSSIGCNCRPCIEHHIRAGRQAGLSEAELADAAAAARAVQDEAIALLASRVDELLDVARLRLKPAPVAESSRARELVALGASVGANAHALLALHIAAAAAAGLSAEEVEAALTMAEHVQRRAGEITATRAAQAHVVRAAAEHAASVHGKPDTGEFRERLRGMLQDEAAMARS